MCLPDKPKIKPPEQPPPPPPPEDPKLKIADDRPKGDDKKRRGRSSLRIQRNPSGVTTGKSGLNVGS